MTGGGDTDDMGPTNSRPAELALPVASLAALRRALVEAVGSDGAARALRVAGHAAGDAFFHALSRQPASSAASSEAAVAASPRELGEAAFWARLSELLSSRGWGTLSHEPVHPGVGELQSGDWVEADASIRALRPACFFSTGMLANLLGQVSGDEVAVMEVECRSRGDARCRFLFGGPAALDELFRRIQSGEELASSLATLA